MSENQNLAIYPYGTPEISPCKKCNGIPEDVYCPDHHGLRGGPWVYIRCTECGYEVNNDTFKELSAIRISDVKAMADIVLTEWNCAKPIWN